MYWVKYSNFSNLLKCLWKSSLYLYCLEVRMKAPYATCPSLFGFCVIGPCLPWVSNIVLPSVTDGAINHLILFCTGLLKAEVYI